MSSVRHVLRDRRGLAPLVIALALLMRMLVPAGYMPSMAGGAITVTLCNGVMPAMQAMPGMSHHGDKPAHPAKELPCGFGSLSAPSLATIDPVLIAIAVAFIVATVFRTASTVPVDACRNRRPPPRGPPIRA